MLDARKTCAEISKIPGTKCIDHKRAVKMYEHTVGDKILPSDLRLPPVLKICSRIQRCVSTFRINSGQHTLDYLFHDLLQEENFSPTFDSIRDRSRAVRNDFTMQHETGLLAIECHKHCTCFHILVLYFECNHQGFSIPLEEQQLMNSEDLLIILCGDRVSNPEQLYKVSKNFMKINTIDASHQMNLRCTYIVVSFISVTNANGMTISHPPSSLTSFPPYHQVFPTHSGQIVTDNQSISVESR